MFAVTSYHDLIDLESRGVVTSILIAERYDKQLLDWIYTCWEDLNTDSGNGWHIAIPSRKQSATLNTNFLETFTSSDFSTEFSRNLRSMYGLKKKHSPCIVFDNFNEEARQRYLQLGAFDESELKQIFSIGAEFLNDRSLADGLNRTELTDDVFDLIRISLIKKHISGVFPGIARFAGTASRLLF